jgi:hypothetical protein
METDSGYGNWDSSCESIGARTAAAGSGHHVGDVPGQHRRRAGQLVRDQKTRRYDEQPWQTVGGRGVSRADRNRW